MNLFFIRGRIVGTVTIFCIMLYYLPSRGLGQFLVPVGAVAVAVVAVGEAQHVLVDQHARRDAGRVEPIQEILKDTFALKIIPNIILLSTEF